MNYIQFYIFLSLLSVTILLFCWMIPIAWLLFEYLTICTLNLPNLRLIGHWIVGDSWSVNSIVKFVTVELDMLVVVSGHWMFDVDYLGI